MSSPLFEIMGNNNNNMLNVIKHFNEFKRSFNGNPQAEVMRLVQSGKISQQQFNQAQAMATQLMSILK